MSNPDFHVARITNGPRYTISGDFHYCVIEADSSSAGETTIAVAYSSSPGAQPGEEWRQRFEAVLWLLPAEELSPLIVALRLLQNWYVPDEEICLICGAADCSGGCYPELAPIKALPADVRRSEMSDGACMSCWTKPSPCYVCGELSHCGCGCRNARCPETAL